jgi:hypothetical protein
MGGDINAAFWSSVIGFNHRTFAGCAQKGENPSVFSSERIAGSRVPGNPYLKSRTEVLFIAPWVKTSV